ncbi:multidrug ABC transporter ATP-binding protein [Aerococcus urinaehominis]|uniref:Multidrug ABC transporter ATP-binding protein n=1 Tax=Aerococcus urinaehominis TaxID=128944 RepID=A0A0X8FM25_9LACT|nr:ABC transporter ATP-binding protein [Aerococcus urinaehominis]AMB99795.1 multidrug ABC transporter ATP-binding protein [Aerococcus urinaehominis]SDM08733.1 ATP-binding cassette, subfamily B, multidrug efflux pump [Aerococcus urinaehominis]
MRFILNYLKAYPKELFFVALGTMAFVFVTLGMPTVLSNMIDQAIIPQNRDQVLFYGWIMLAIVVVGFLGRLLTAYATAKIVNHMTMTIRNEVYAKMQSLSHHEFQELGVPSLTTRITTDAFILLQFTEMFLRQGLSSPVMIGVSVYMIWLTSPSLGLFILPVVPLIIGMIVLVAKVSRPISEAQQSNLDKINRILRESITGLRVIRAFNREDFQESRFVAVNQKFRQLSTKLFRWMAATPPVFSFLLNAVIIVIFWYGSQQIEAQNLQIGNLVAFIEYAFHALFSLIVFSNIFMMYPRMMVSTGRIQEVLHTPITVENPDNPVKGAPEQGTLEFRHVDFAYPDAVEPVLRDISFKSKAGETTAFIGSTGSGKSTIIKLIPRFYDATAGQVLVDGIDVRDYDLDDLRKKIGYTPQKALLFTGDISDNLRYGKEDATEQEMVHATDISHAREFIERLETRFNTHLAEGGSNLSGGQKQRLSIARSIIGGREIYIFDDSFSALDYKTDAEVRAALKEETKQASTIIVAQRVGTIMHADQIIVLDKGRIVARGTHQELLKSSPIYYDIASSQLTEEELNNDY